MFKISNKVRRLSDKEKLQYKNDGYITALPVFSEEAKHDLDNFFVSLSTSLDKELDLNKTAQWHKPAKSSTIYVVLQ